MPCVPEAHRDATASRCAAASVRGSLLLERVREGVLRRKGGTALGGTPACLPKRRAARMSGSRRPCASTANALGCSYRLRTTRILAHSLGLTRPERAEPTSQVLIRHRGNGTLDSMRRWGGGRWSAKLRHHDCPGSFRTGCVTGALLLETLDSAPYPNPSLPGELKTAKNGGSDYE